MRNRLLIFFVLGTLSLGTCPASGQNLDDIILDIYRAATELGETDYEQLQTDLYALHDAPIDLNHTSEEELSRLPFLSPHQIDELLAYADRHPFLSLYELRLIPSLADYEIRDLLPFVQITNDQSPGASFRLSEEDRVRSAEKGNNHTPILNHQSPITNHQSPLYPREVFHYAKHELLARIDARNIEDFEGSDPVYLQTRYRFDFRRRVTFGLQLRRPAGTTAHDLQYGAFLQLRDIGPLHTLVAGHFQASFGQGLVMAPAFHTGKSAYVQSVGMQPAGLRYYSSADGQGLQGIGATFRHAFSPHTRLDVSALYSLKRANDSVLHHLVGTNLTFRHRQLELQLTAIENIWSDTIRPYRNTTYNSHYFRGTNQAVLGASARYNYGWFDAFAEIATAQNYQSSISNYQLREAHWGVGVIAGSRFYPASGVSLVALGRYYSPYFDNPMGYAYSETARLGDELGGYLGFDISRWRNWRLSGYGDVFYFSGPKYGIPDHPTLGYDVMAELLYHHSTISSFSEAAHSVIPQWRLSLRLRARKKGESAYSARLLFDWSEGQLALRSTAEANLVNQSPGASFRLSEEDRVRSAEKGIKNNNLSPLTNNQSPITYGYTLFQDVSYSLPFRGGPGKGLSFRFRLQWFDAREWANRIYCYEHDVLYAYSSSAVYGMGGRAYVCLRWQIIPQLALYLRVSETLYTKRWAADHDRPFTRTDVHLLFRATL